ncbi:MAG: aldo/keto reductase [Opitutae bacterium]|nr:aldo/keto reductase [Opitutae bacterium]
MADKLRSIGPTANEHLAARARRRARRDPALRRSGLGLKVWRPLATGFLSGQYTRDNLSAPDPRFSGSDLPPFGKETGIALVERLRRIALAHRASVAQTAVARLLARAAVSSVILDASKLPRLEENLGAAGVRWAPTNWRSSTAPPPSRPRIRTGSASAPPSTGRSRAHCRARDAVRPVAGRDRAVAPLASALPCSGRGEPRARHPATSPPRARAGSSALRGAPRSTGAGAPRSVAQGSPAPPPVRSRRPRNAPDPPPPPGEVSYNT